VLGAVYAITLFIRLIGGPHDAGQAIAQAFHGFFGAGLTLIGAATLAAAIFEHQGIRPSFLTKWRVKDLGAFGLADPAAWGASMAGTETAKATWMPKTQTKAWPGGEHLFSFLAVGMFVLWWIGVLHFPGLMSIELRGQDAVVSGAPIWSILFGPILLYAFAQMAVDLASLVRPYAVRARAAAQIVLASGGLWLTWTIFEAGHWFTLTAGEETARIAGDGSMLHLDTLRNLGDRARDLAGIADTLAVVMVWVLAISAISLVFKVVNNLWRLGRG
ncbi:MAG: hypothetical protein Q8O54_07480, partial [Brevundimonas sp.]|nr:hypothetical protein [Brevundimonas sp.]